MPANPNRRHLEAAAGSRFLSAVVAENVRAARRLHNLNQEVVSARMRQLGHATWSRAALSEAERGNRSITLDELFSLAVVLDTPLLDLLDPTGPEGRKPEAIDYGNQATVPAIVARAWTRGHVRLEFRGPGSYDAWPVPGFEDEWKLVNKAIDDDRLQRTIRRSERVAAEERRKTKKGKR